MIRKPNPRFAMRARVRAWGWHGKKSDSHTVNAGLPPLVRSDIGKGLRQRGCYYEVRGTQEMSINVIVADRVEEQAYNMGFRRFERFENTGEDQSDLDLSGFRGGAEYANHVLPDLRALAGFEDAGHGTYQDGGEIVIIDEANLDDDPITGATWNSQEYLNQLVNRWHDGARDALDADSEHGDSL